MSVTYDNTDLLSTIMYLRETFGKEALSDSRKMQSLLSDLAPSLKREGRIFALLIENGYYTLFEQADTEGENARNMACSKALAFLEGEYIQKEQASYCVDVLACFFGWCSEDTVKESLRVMRQKEEEQNRIKAELEEQESRAAKTERAEAERIEQERLRSEELEMEFRIRQEEEDRFKKQLAREKNRNAELNSLSDQKKQEAEFATLFQEIQLKSEDGMFFSVIYDERSKERKKLYCLANEEQKQRLDDFFLRYDNNLKMYRDYKSVRTDVLGLSYLLSKEAGVTENRREMDELIRKKRELSLIRGNLLLISVFWPLIMAFSFYKLYMEEFTENVFRIHWHLLILLGCFIICHTIRLLFRKGDLGELSILHGIGADLADAAISIFPSIVLYFVFMYVFVRAGSRYQPSLDLTSILDEVYSVIQMIIIVIVLAVGVFIYIKTESFLIVLFFCFLVTAFLIYVLPQEITSFQTSTLVSLSGLLKTGALAVFGVSLAIRLLFWLNKLVKWIRIRNLEGQLKRHREKERQYREKFYDAIYKKYSPYIHISYLNDWPDLQQITKIPEDK